uniref:Site-specific DNA-methyltransferase n=1 Tax=Enterococcus hirae TaxID=1354 RepID=A0A6M2Z7N8_ENTHR|nr:site-specific DNA-methyltransferase [Enterococcus hirae]QEO73312.1 site-specific DNA-methyltransferase [Enterococcus hirae]
MTELNPMNGETLNLTNENIQKLKKLFPEVLTEDQIDFEKLRLILGDEIDDKPEKYSFTWNGKKDALKLAQQPSTGTLRPNKENSKNWDTTENLYIEGDNLEVLKMLQKSYSGKIKVIYIDPPYNTGKDFVYKDDFKDNVKNYFEQTDQLDSEGNRFSTNLESNGRFHTDWLNMMYPRLALAKNLLTDDGVIFISIDDGEQENLKKICNEVFGEQNFLAQVIWERAFSPINLKKNFSESHDYILVYAKNINNVETSGLPRENKQDSLYSNPDNDPRGFWMSSDFSVGPAVESNIYEITTPSGRKVVPPSGRSWLYTEEKTKALIKDNRVWFGEEGNGVPRTKRFLSEVKQGVTPMTIWNYKDVGHSQSASQDLKKIFNGKAYFTYPKPVRLIKRILQLYSEPNSIILDFFAGSSTTAHATMELNAEDGGNRKFIMVQLPEPLSEKEVAYKDGYKNISEISQERIARAGKKLVEDKQLIEGELDTGFKVFELDNSNIQKWSMDSEDIEESLFSMQNNFVGGRTYADIVFEVLLKLGLNLNTPFEENMVDGSTVYDVAFGNVYVVLGDNITQEVANYIADKQKDHENENPSVVFNDNGFVNDNEKLNSVEILKNNGFNEEQLMSI